MAHARLPNRAQRPVRSKRKYKQQSDLLNRVNQETLRQGQAQDGADTKSAGRRISEIVAYKSVSEVPATKELKIEARDCVLTVVTLTTPCVVPAVSQLLRSWSMAFRVRRGPISVQHTASPESYQCLMSSAG